MDEIKCIAVNENCKRENLKVELLYDEKVYYISLLNCITENNFSEFRRLANSSDDFKKWINKKVFMSGKNDRRISKIHSISTLVLTNQSNDGSGGGNGVGGSGGAGGVKMVRPQVTQSLNKSKMHRHNAMTLCHHAAFGHSTEIMRFLILNGGDLSVQILEIDESKKMRKLTNTDSVLSLIVIHFREPLSFLTKVFNEFINCDDIDNDFEFTLDFSILCPTVNDFWTKDYVKKKPSKQMAVLNSILNSSDDMHCEQYQLLTHPLIESFLSCKWQHYRRFFFTLVFLHFCFVASISMSIITLVKSCQWFQNETISYLLDKNNTVVEGEFDAMRLADVEASFDSVMDSIKYFNGFAVIFGGFLFVHAIIQASFIPLKKLFWELEIVLNLFTAPAAIFLSIYMIQLPAVALFDENYRWIFHVASCLILPVWINLMLLVGRFPRLGCYSLMFTTVLQNFMKVMISFIFLIIGFALSFSLVFPQSEYFRDPAQATLRTVVMMIGEFDYISTFSDEENYFIIGTSRVIFLLFVISCSIILMNLTQGIAVNDIKLLHQISQIIRLEKETRFLYELECVFTHPIMTSHPFFRKIKRKLFDHGTNIQPVKVTRNHKIGLSKSVYDTLMREYKSYK